MKFQIILAAIFGAFVSSKKFYGYGCHGGYGCYGRNDKQNVDICNYAKADADSIAVNLGYGDANAKSIANAGNCNDVKQVQRDY
jgi:hypothetical protein